MNHKEAESLDPPHTVATANTSIELVRIWLVDGRQDVVINRNLWDDPATWGLMLVDLAKHLANAYEKNGKDRQEALDRIVEGFKAEIEHATDTPLEVKP